MAEFAVNGTAVSVGDHHEHLLAALRDELRITSPKDGCSPSGQCGCCTVLIDGKARISCQTSLEKAAGAEITTLEGVDDADRQRLADAFAADSLGQHNGFTERRELAAVAVAAGHHRERSGFEVFGRCVDGLDGRERAHRMRNPQIQRARGFDGSAQRRYSWMLAAGLRWI